MGSFRKGMGFGTLLILLFVFISWAYTKTGWGWLWWAIPLSPLLLLLGIMAVAGVFTVVMGAWVWLTDRPTFNAMMQTERDIAAGKYRRERPNVDREKDR